MKADVKAIKIAFIGGGNMANALIGGLANKLCHASDILVIDPSAEALRKLQQQWGVTTATAATEAASALQQTDVVILATKPQQLHDAAQTIATQVTQALIISIAAGIRARDLSRWLGGHTRIIRTMPNTPALIGAGITGMAALAQVSDMDRTLADTILRTVGTTVWVDQEEQLDAVTAVSGSGPAYVFYFIEALCEAARDMGLNETQGKQLALATFLGASQLAQQSDETPQTLRERVTSKGGTTAAALASLEQDQVKTAIIRALQAAQQRAKTLGDELAQ